jgi:pimeloyl-ACP methyl ester carboxylesterase
MGWLTVPDGEGASTGVLMLPAVGYQYWSAHRTLRVLAERLAGAGHLALRLDYEGTGDSAGEQRDPDRLDAWRRSVVAAADELRSLGCSRLVVVGVRMGAALALSEGAELGAEAIVAWAPVVSGRRYARELRMLATPLPEGHDDLAEPGAVGVAGTLFGPATLEALSQLDLLALDRPPAPRILVVESKGEPKLCARLRELGAAEVEQASIPGAETALEVPTEDAVVPEQIVDAIERWVGPGTDGSAPTSEPCLRATLSWGDAELEEQVIELGAERMVAIHTRSLSVPPRPGAVTAVFLNTGSEAHVGPGRAWVEYARGLAARGHHTVRVDFRGWGESPDDEHAPGRPYDEHCERDTVSIIRALRERGHERIVLIGLCASAWIALRTVLHEPVEGVIALNPQLYWQPGDPVEATMAETRLRRTAERDREERGGRLGLWSVLDVLGARPWAGRWLDRLNESGVPVTMVFAGGDDGIEYLGNRLRRRLSRVRRSGSIDVVEVPDIDHSMHRLWLRERMLEVLDQRLRLLEG